MDGAGSRYAELARVRLHYVEEGSGPPVVLLHGFPDMWKTWSAQLSALARAGFRTIAVDMTGYNLSGKPEGVSAYRPEALAADVSDFIERVCGGRAHLVGHDWGGIVAWYTAMWHPEVVDRLAIANVPHPARFAEMTRTPAQLARIWYVALFQLPVVPERWLSANDYSILKRMLRGSSKTFTDADLRDWQEAAERSRALHYPLNYYRALRRRNPLRPGRSLEAIPHPTLVLWGERDSALDARFAAPGDHWAPDHRVETFERAGHWVHRDEPERFNELLTRHLAAR